MIDKFTHKKQPITLQDITLYDELLLEKVRKLKDAGLVIFEISEELNIPIFKAAKFYEMDEELDQRPKLKRQIIRYKNEMAKNNIQLLKIPHEKHLKYGEDYTTW